MDNLPKDPPDENNNNDNSVPPSFGSGFNPHSNPVDPNNPYSSQPPQNPNPAQQGQTPLNPDSPNTPDPHPDSVHSEIAQHRPRDAHGHFLPYEHPINPQPDSTPQSSPTPSNTPNSPNESTPHLPPPISITENTKYSEKKDPPLLNMTFTNPVTYFKKWLDKFLKNQDIDLHLRIRPFAAIGLIMTFSVVGGAAFTIGRFFFPYSSPIYHRQVVYPGIIQKGVGNQYLLMASDGTPWKLKPKNPSLNLENLIGRQAIVTGNLTKEKYLIEVSELIVSDTSSQNTNSVSSSTTSKTLSAVEGPNIPNQDLLPKLYSDIKWEKTERKVILFTSGKRRIEQEGIYMESEQLPNFPQAFVDYYTNQLTSSGFKETLNSSESSGTTITYSKDDLFLTFGIKNIYKGSGDSKQLVGYKAYLEHN